MANRARVSQDVLAPYRTQTDVLVRASLNKHSDLPLYGMLRYFMGFADEELNPVETIAGKRIRSSLLLLIADMFGGASSADDLAVAVELFHNFTLIHDDIEDHDEMRRGRPTVWKLWGIDHGINAGDAQILVTSTLLLEAAKDTQGACAAQHLNAHFLEVIEGQYLDFELAKKPLGDTFVRDDTYLTMIRKKTAVLVGTAVAAGGLAAGCSKDVRDALFTYGESLGMAYQIADDMSSIWGDVEKTGKRAQGDIYERKKTYPILYARDHEAGARLIELYGGVEDFEAKDVAEILAILEKTDACAATRQLGKKYMHVAKNAVQKLPLAESHKQTLTGLVDALVHFSPEQHASD